MCGEKLSVYKPYSVGEDLYNQLPCRNANKQELRICSPIVEYCSIWSCYILRVYCFRISVSIAKQGPSQWLRHCSTKDRTLVYYGDTKCLDRLTKVYIVTIRIFPESYTRTNVSKCIFSDVWIQNFVWNFKVAPWNSHKILKPCIAKYAFYELLNF